MDEAQGSVEEGGLFFKDKDKPVDPGYREVGKRYEPVNLCIFLQSGHTFSFHDVRILTDNETMLVFSYVAMSDRKLKMGHFPKNTMAGWSTH